VDFNVAMSISVFMKIRQLAQTLSGQQTAMPVFPYHTKMSLAVTMETGQL
jgi:hypothetical protein